MRILTFLHSFEPGGVERVALRLQRAWIACGIDAKLVMGRSDGVMRSETAGLDYLTLSKGRIPTAAWETLWMILRLPRVIREMRPDVLFCAGNSYTVVSVAMKLILGRNCPPIVAKISNDLSRADMIGPYRWAYHRWLRIQGRMIDHFVGMAPPMQNEIAEAIGVPSSQISIIDDPSLLDEELVRYINARNDRSPGYGRRYLGIGRLARQKNFGLLLNAFAKIARPEDRLTILGEGPDREALTRQAKRLGIDNQLLMPGYTTDLPSQFAKHDMFVMSSDFEGVPAVIAEALAAGIAITTTDCSVSIIDMLDGGRLGKLVPVRDAVALAQAMDDAIDNPNSPTQRQAHAKRFTIGRAAMAYADIFKSLMR